MTELDSEAEQKKLTNKVLAMYELQTYLLEHEGFNFLIQLSSENKSETEFREWIEDLVMRLTVIDDYIKTVNLNNINFDSIAHEIYFKRKPKSKGR
jgi:hypothetical protein